MAFEKKPYYNKKGSWQKKEPKVNEYKPKRGKLAPLMTEEQKSTANIQDLSYDFACRIVRLYQYLNEDAEYREYTMSKQVYRSGTSIGANVREAQHAQSDNDVLSKMSISYKEADESNYWIRLLHDNGYLTDGMFSSLDSDNQRILRLLASIVKTTKQKIEKSKEK